VSEGYHTEDEAQQRAYDSGLMKRLLVYVRPYRALMLGAVVLLLLAALLSALMPFVQMKAIDQFIQNPERLHQERQLADTPGNAPGLQGQRDALSALDRSGLGRLILLLAVLIISEALVRYVQSIIVAYVGQKTMLEMRVGLFAHLQRMSLEFLDRNPVGRLMTRVTNDVEKIQQTIVSGTVQVCSDLFTIFVVLGFMIWLDWRQAALILTVVPFVFVTSLIFRKFARHSYLEIRRKLAALNAYMQENVSGVRVVQVFNREATNFDEYSRLNASHRDEWCRQVRNYAVYFPTVEFLGSFAIALVILYQGHRILGAQAAGLMSSATVGSIFAYVQWSERLFGPIRALAERYNMLLEAMASSERIFRLLDTPEDIREKPDAITAGRVQGAVEFKDVWFAYEPEQWVLKNINLQIAPGERVAIVGHTGAGKTTFINLMSRFYDVQRGAITVDGIDIRDYEKEGLRRNIGIVLQDVFLFSGSIERNIHLGNYALSDEQIRSCAEYVNAASFIDKAEEGYAYDVGERGSNLSTGQRQLVAFARTLAHDPQILVLDEATSSVDTTTEALIQDAILKLMEGRTSIVIAHRLSTVQHADRIVVFHHGEIREMGTHQELLSKKGIYYRLYQLQYKDQNGTSG
jgi:ATP-binding cassette, subfamily B, multidrug efflux pump